MSTGSSLTTSATSAITATTGGATTTSSGVSGVTSSAAAASSAVSNIVSGSFNAGRFRQAEGGTVINLSVTGAFDREGTARTIVDTLNDSYYRGTGGATSLQIA
jgi:hypothetical protein